MSELAYAPMGQGPDYSYCHNIRVHTFDDMLGGDVPICGDGVFLDDPLLWLTVRGAVRGTGSTVWIR